MITLFFGRRLILRVILDNFLRVEEHLEIGNLGIDLTFCGMTLFQNGSINEKNSFNSEDEILFRNSFSTCVEMERSN